jgi:hypothetical protein
MAQDPAAVAKVRFFMCLFFPAASAHRRARARSLCLSPSTPITTAQAFTDHYYNTFDTNRAALAALYQVREEGKSGGWGVSPLNFCAVVARRASEKEKKNSRAHPLCHRHTSRTSPS